MPGLLFDTPLGACALSWHEDRLLRVFLPEAPAALRAQLEPPVVPLGQAPEWVRTLAERLVRHLGGQPQDFRDVALPWERVTPFQRAVFEAARSLPPGVTASYGELATRVGRPQGAQAIGQALGRNPWPVIVPCHRVLAARHGAGGFSAVGGLRLKAALLAAEGHQLELPS